MTRGYDQKQVGSSGVFNDGFPEYDGTPRSFQMCEQHPTKFLFHLELFADTRKHEESNIYKTIMSELGHEFTDDKLIVLGTKNYKLPRVRGLDAIGPRNGRRIRLQRIGPVRNTFVFPEETARSDIVLDRDVDIFAAEQHLMMLVTKDPYFPNDEIGKDLETSYPPPTISAIRRVQRNNGVLIKQKNLHLIIFLLANFVIQSFIERQYIYRRRLAIQIVLSI